jgi:hypothetical protein
MITLVIGSPFSVSWTNDDTLGLTAPRAHFFKAGEEVEDVACSLVDGEWIAEVAKDVLTDTGIYSIQLMEKDLTGFKNPTVLEIRLKSEGI